MFPQLQTLSLVSFIDNQLNLFLDKIQNLYHLVKLDIRNFQDDNTEVLLKKVLVANNNRLKIVFFDHNSISFILPATENKKGIFYPNIEELTVNLTTDKTLGHLFILVPHINRLHIDFDLLSFDSKPTLANVSPLVHLKDFQLRSMNTYWSLDEIAHIMSKMPSLQRLALNLCTDDAHLANGQNFIRVLPSSLVEIHLFIMYYFDELYIEVDTLLATWSNHIQIKCLLNKFNLYAVLHTFPCDLPSMVIPGTIANFMLTGSEYTRNVKYLRIYGEQCSTDIHLIVQHFHRLRMLSIGSNINSKTRMLFSTKIFSMKN
ncbi:unnamed protein product [Rotaria sp. Silwood1]|nr:unnamed protein product [Rotaria sp. Silwood1]